MERRTFIGSAIAALAGIAATAKAKVLGTEFPEHFVVVEESGNFEVGTRGKLDIIAITHERATDGGRGVLTVVYHNPIVKGQPDYLRVGSTRIDAETVSQPPFYAGDNHCFSFASNDSRPKLTIDYVRA